MCRPKNAKDEDDEDDAEDQSGPVTPVSRVPKRNRSQSQIGDGQGASGSAIQPDDLLQLVESSRSHQEFVDLLTTCYVPMETWYTRTIIDKVRVLARQLSTLKLSIGSPTIHP